MTTDRVLLALIAALPGIITALAALRHSQNTRRSVAGRSQPKPTPNGPARANR